MSYQVKAYHSISELLGCVSTEIEQSRVKMQRVLDAFNDLRKRNERAKRLQQAFLNGSRTPDPVPKGVRFGELDVVVNARADDELLALELMMRAQNDRLVALGKIRETLTKLEARSHEDALKDISCLVIENDGVPRKLMFQDRSHFESVAMSSLFPTSPQRLRAAVDHASIQEQTGLGDVQLEMSSLLQASNERRDKDEATQAAISEAVTEPVAKPVTQPVHATSDGRLGNIFRFVAPKQIHN